MFQNFVLDSNCYISAHVSQIRLLACFLHGHNVKHIFSERLARGEPGQAGNSWWLRIRFGPGEWSWLGRAASGAREKSSAALHTSSLTHREKNPHRSGGKWNVAMFYKSMLWRFVRVYQLFLSQCCEMFSKGHPAGGKKKNDMNAKLSNIVDGKSMTCMQFSNSSSAATRTRQCLDWNIHRAREDQRLQKESPNCRGGWQQTHNTC